jgi:hypothetical protein
MRTLCGFLFAIALFYLFHGITCKLYIFAKRIRVRAITRCGELIKEIKKVNGKRTDLEPKGS